MSQDYPGLLGHSLSPGLSLAFRSLRLRNNPHGVGTMGLLDSPNVPGMSQSSEIYVCCLRFPE